MKEFNIDGRKIESLTDLEWSIIYILREVKGVTVTDQSIENKSKSEMVGNLLSIKDYLKDIADVDNPITLKITNSENLRKNLGYTATVKFNEKTLANFKNQFPNEVVGVKVLESQTELAKLKEGPTLFSLFIQDVLENENIKLEII